jgi:hypothetical protein
MSMPSSTASGSGSQSNPSAGGTSAGGSGSQGATGGSSAGGSGSQGATGGSSAGGSGSQGAGSTGGSSAGALEANTPAPSSGPNKWDDVVVPVLTNLLGLVLSIAETVYSCIEQSMDLAGTLDRKARDNINISALIIDNSLIMAVTFILCFIETVDSGKIAIGADGSITLRAEKENSIFVTSSAQVATPTSVITKVPYLIKIVQSVVEIGQLSANFGMAVKALKSQNDAYEKEAL